jgi:DNA repair protein RecO (recombination protein O)
MNVFNAILLRKIRFSETSLILGWFTDRHGKLKTMAKGALRPKSPFAGKLDLFFHCELLVSFSRKSELHTLREVSVKEPFAVVRTSYLRTVAASYFAELVEEVTEPEHAVVEIYHLCLRALSYLNTKEPDLRAIQFFEFELCRFLGLEAQRPDSGAERLAEAFGRLPASRTGVLRALCRAPGPGGAEK